MIISGWFRFSSTGTVQAETTLFTLGDSKQYKSRYYLPLFTGDNSKPVDFQLECRENTNIARTRAAVTPNTSVFYYVSAAVILK